MQVVVSALAFGLSIGGASQDRCYHGITLPSGEVVLSGRTLSFHPPGANNYEIPVLKIDANASVVWQFVFGEQGVDRVYELREDGGDIVLVGRADVNDPLNNVGDLMLMRLNSSGNLIWGYTYGGNYCDDYGTSLEILGGNVYATGTFRCWSSSNTYSIPVLKTDPSGNVLWAKIYDGSGMDWANHISVLPDGNLLVVGYTYSFGAGGRDVIAIKLNPGNGNVLWAKAYGTPSDDEGKWFAVLPDGSIGIVGVSGGNALFLKVDNSGNLQTAKTYTFSASSEANSIGVISGRIFIAGGENAAFLMEVDLSGNPLSTRGWSSSLGDWFESVEVFTSGELLLCGVWGTGAQDIALLKVPSDLSYSCPLYDVSLSPTANSVSLVETDITSLLQVSDITSTVQSNREPYTPAVMTPSFSTTLVCPLTQSGSLGVDEKDRGGSRSGACYSADGRLNRSADRGVCCTPNGCRVNLNAR